MVDYNFNPHSHAGSDVGIFLVLQQIVGISIHTPTQGVTGRHDRRVEGARHFNPHSHAGSDPSCIPPARRRWHFNPHSHAGSDCGNCTSRKKPHYFNPHSHAGSDAAEVCGMDRRISISIHTPTQGVTPEGAAAGGCRKDFNPHSHAGSDKQ